MPTAHLVVRRTSPLDIKIRDLYVRVDDREEVNLDFGQSLEVELEAGSHVVHVSNRLYSRRLTVELTEGSTENLDAMNLAKGCFAPMFLIFGIGPYQVGLSRALPFGSD